MFKTKLEPGSGGHAYLWGALLFLGVTTTLRVAQGDDRKPPRLRPECILKRAEGFRVTDRVLFVVDVSSSMDGERREQAIDSVLLITGSDGFRVGGIAFTGSYTRWAGVPCCDKAWHQRQKPAPSVQGIQGLSLLMTTPCGPRCVPPEWAAVPRDYAKFKSWLLGLKCGGSTDPLGALKAALHDETPRLTIVFVSDGEFNAGCDGKVLSVIKAGEAWRKARGLGKAGIMVWGAGDDARKNKNLLAIAKLGGGGFWVHGRPTPAGPF